MSDTTSDNKIETGRALHAIITNCDDIWSQMDTEEKSSWAEYEKELLRKLGVAEKLGLAGDAINYTLKRIQQDENIRYHMGAFTEAFERLKKANCALNGITEEAVEEEIFGHPLKHKPKAELLKEITDIVHEYSDQPESQAREAITKIAAVLGW